MRAFGLKLLFFLRVLLNPASIVPRKSVYIVEPVCDSSELVIGRGCVPALLVMDALKMAVAAIASLAMR